VAGATALRWRRWHVGPVMADPGAVGGTWEAAMADAGGVGGTWEAAMADAGGVGGT
jgi:hypothetical protein